MIQSIYDLQYFNCPTCVFKNSSKQEFINHAYEIHPWAVAYLDNVEDGSLNDIACPWNDYLNGGKIQIQYDKRKGKWNENIKKKRAKLEDVTEDGSDGDENNESNFELDSFNHEPETDFGEENNSSNLQLSTNQSKFVNR